MVDTISSLASIDYRHDAWKVDVTVAGSQKGLMLPPGLAFVSVSPKAAKVFERNPNPRTFYFDLKKALAAEEGGRRWLRRLAIGGSFVLVIASAMAWRAAHAPPPPAKYVSATVAAGDVVEKVQATGTVQPMLSVSVARTVASADLSRNGTRTREPIPIRSASVSGTE